ncbi:protein of unassigned function [Methylobacterium oryzae CBMB20]|uniref:Protein of unassigned function n=1 Tax=Methylobacterium oryzae CBMB20 TaxID=693986 RepID=A0A089PZY6_9HYPH|nr:protein of unassigned function [Methylobacterium oryzae CBMB20]
MSGLGVDHPATLAPNPGRLAPDGPDRWSQRRSEIGGSARDCLVHTTRPARTRVVPGSGLVQAV